MSNSPRKKEYDMLFCYFLDTYLSIQKFGCADIPKCIFNYEESENVSSFLNEGIQLISCAYSITEFNILLEILYLKAYKKSSDLLEISKLVLINKCIKLIHNKDFESFLETSNMWTPTVFEYGLLKIYPELKIYPKSENCLELETHPNPNWSWRNQYAKHMLFETS